MRVKSVSSESQPGHSPQDKSIVWLPGLFSDRAGSDTMSATRKGAELKLAKWPFLLGDALLLLAAYIICSQSARPIGFWQVALVVLCVAGGTCLSITPFLLEYRVLAKLAEAWERTTALAELPKSEFVTSPTTASQRQGEEAQACGAGNPKPEIRNPKQTQIEEKAEAGKTRSGETTAATERNVGGTSIEAQGPTELTQPTDDGEKVNLRLEVEKLRRQEGDWLRVLVRMLDHVYALQVGALRSGQPHLIDQVSRFQDTCREAARHVGLRPLIAEPGEGFDPHRHQPLDGEDPVPAEAIVAETIATGYTFQGGLLRPALVRLAKSAGAESADEQADG